MRNFNGFLLSRSHVLISEVIKDNGESVECHSANNAYVPSKEPCENFSTINTHPGGMI